MTILHRSEQACAAVIIAVSLTLIAGYWLKEFRRQDDLIDVQRAVVPVVEFQLDVNAASWSEFAVLPGLGETLAKRIVASRESEGPFRDHDDLRRVRGIGPRTLERIRPYLLPIPEIESVAGPEQ
jgi:competence protein ComEA